MKYVKLAWNAATSPLALFVCLVALMVGLQYAGSPVRPCDCGPVTECACPVVKSCECKPQKACDCKPVKPCKCGCGKVGE